MPRFFACGERMNWRKPSNSVLAFYVTSTYHNLIRAHSAVINHGGVTKYIENVIYVLDA